MGILSLETETGLSQCRKNVFAVFAILVIVLSIYSNTFRASWHFDDEPNILDRKAIHMKEFTWPQIRNTFFLEQKIYRPVACLSLALNYYFGKDDVFGYHVLNLSIHFFASLFLFFFIYNTLNLPLVKAKYGPHSHFIALLATVFWAINPIQTQAVTYVVQRMASMAGMFYIMSLYFYLKGRISEKGLQRILHYFFCFVTAILAFASKENAAMVPLSILLFDVFLIQGLTKENIKKNSLLLFALILIPFALALILKGPSILHPDSLVSKYEHRSFTLLERLLTQPRVILLYISLLLYPMPNRLSIHHDISPSDSLIDPPTTLLAIFVILFILGMSVAKAKKWPLISYCIIFYFLNHLVESSIFPLELFFEHRNYLPSMLFFVPISILIFRIVQTFYHKKAIRFAICAFLVLLLIGFGHSTFIRNAIWRTEESLWLDAVEKNPDSPRAHHNLGRFYANNNQIEKAVEEYKLALKKRRGTHGEIHHKSHYNLALEYMKMNEEEKARNHLLKAIEVFPRFADAYNNLSIIMAKEGKYDEAYDYLITSLTYDRDSAEAHNNLGYMLIKRNQIEEAITEFQKALELKEGYRMALHNLGIAYKYKGDLLKAARHFRSLLHQDPRALLTLLHLAETYHLMGNSESASRTISRTLDLLTPRVVYSSLKKLCQTPENNLQELPDMSIIMPLLKNAYLERGTSLKKMGSDLWEAKDRD